MESTSHPIVDAHHHLWDLARNPYPWLEAEPEPDAWVGDITPIRRDYLVEEYVAEAAPCGVVKSVHVQAEWDPADPVGETRWLQAVADEHGFPHAIVAAARLEDPRVDEVLEAHLAFANVRGIRQMLDRGEGPALLEDRRWVRGLTRLAAYGLSFDLQVNPDQLDSSARLAQRNPDVRFVLNHCGLPRERTPEALDLWRRGLRRLAEQPNVSAKVSGLGMFEHSWTMQTIRPFLEEMLDAFGVKRCMFASNFPVDKLYSSYVTLVQAMQRLTSGLSESECRAFFHDNAANVYRI
jgi:predicted TIM-barrel fold metal-dependent hydrolase